METWRNFKKFKVKGITLVELMIAMALSTVVAGTIVAIVATGTRLWRSSAGKYTSVQATRILLNKIERELREASHIYQADGDAIAFYRQGYSITPLDSNLESQLDSDSPYDPRWKGKKYDIVKFYIDYTQKAVMREVYDGYTPTLKLCEAMPISDTDVSVQALRFIYFNYDNYLDRLPWLPWTVPPGRLYTPGVIPSPYKKVVDCWIYPQNYPQNRWEKLTWIERLSTFYYYCPVHTDQISLDPAVCSICGTEMVPNNSVERLPDIPTGADVKMQVRKCTPKVWWDDAIPGGNAFGTWNWDSLPDFNPYSGEKAHTEPLGSGVRIHWFQNATTSMAVPDRGDTILPRQQVVAGPGGWSGISFPKTISPPSQLEITLGKNGITEGSGYVKIKGTDAGGANIEEEIEFYGAGETRTTIKVFATITEITTRNLADETNPPTISIIHPDKKVWIFTHAYIDPNFPPEVIMLGFRNASNPSDWRFAYWCSFPDRRRDVTPSNDEDGDGNPENDGLIPSGREGTNRFWLGPVPKPGKWVTLAVPAAVLGLEGRTVDGQSFAIYGEGFGARVWWDKCELCEWEPSPWHSTIYHNYGSATTPELDITGLRPGLYFQYKASLKTQSLTISPVIKETTVTHPEPWTLTSDDDWYSGSMNNTLASGGDLKLYQLSGDENLTQGEVGPYNIDLRGYSYYGVQAPGYGAGSTTGIWKYIRWTRSGESGWSPNFSQWQYRRRITLQETKGLPRKLEVVIVDIPDTHIKPDGSDIRITTANGTEKPFKYLGKFGSYHRVMFLGSCPSGYPGNPGTFTYFVYYGNASATMPTYTKSSTPAWPAGTGVIGNYFKYNVRYRGGDNFYPLFPTNTGPDVPGPSNSQGSFEEQTRDPEPVINFNWGTGGPNKGSCGPDYFSVSWRGFMYLDQTANWTFRINKDSDSWGVARVYIDDMTTPKVNINNIAANGKVIGGDTSSSKDATVNLPLGMHQLRVDYSEYAGAANIAILRSRGTFEVIPKQDLYPSHEFPDPPANNGYGLVGYVIGPEQNQGQIDYPDKIVLQTRTSEDGVNWSNWEPATPFGEPPDYPYDGGATTANYTITSPARRFLQFKATLSTSDFTVSPILAQVKVYNVALDPDGDSATGPEGWITQDTYDDWEAGLVGTATDPGMPPSLQNVPSVNVRKYPGSVTLASQVGNLIDATQERTANVNFGKITTHSYIWDTIYWALGTPEWPQPLYRYRRKITFEEKNGIPRYREPVIFTIDDPNIQDGTNGPAGGDIRIVNGMGSFVPYLLLRAQPPKFTLMILATIPPKGTLSYWLYYYKVDPVTGNRTADPGETYKKTTQVKWPDGLGPVGNYFSYAPSSGDNRAQIDAKQFWGTLQGQKQSPTINFNWSCGNPGVGSCGSDYFSVGWRGFIYLNPDAPAGNWQFRIKREDNELGCGLRPQELDDSKRKGYMSVYIGHTYSATAPTGNSKNYSGIDLGGVYTDRYIWANTAQGVEQYDVLTDSTPYNYAGARGMQLLTVNYAEYAGQAKAQLYWTPPGGAEQIVPQTELYGFYSRIKGQTLEGAEPISLKSIGDPEERQWQEIPGTTVQLQTRLSEDGYNYTGYTTYSIYGSNPDDSQGFAKRDIPQASGNQRYIQVRTNLSTTDTNKTPILAEVGVYNRATGSFYRLTEQPDFEGFETLDNVDTYSSPGNLMLVAGTGENLSIKENIYNPDYAKSNYANPIWTKIKWIRASTRWPYPEYLYRRKITFTETAGIMRVNEPVVFAIDDPNIQADGKDIRITDMNGSKKPYQLLKASNPFHILMLVNCAPNSSVSYYLYYWRLSQPGEITSPRAIDPGETYNKTTSTVKWPAGTGLVGSYYTYNTSAPRINYQNYKGQWKSPQINFNWGTQGPVANDYFSATWNGFVYASGSPSTTYKLRAQYNQGIKVYIGNPSPMNLNANPASKRIENIIGGADGSADTTDVAGYTLSQGFHKIRIEYDEYAGDAWLRLSGILTGGNSSDPPPDPSTTPIPQSELYGYYGNGAEFANNGYQYISGPLVSGLNNPTIGAVEQQGAGWNLDGNIEVRTQTSHDGSTWNPADPGAGPHAGGTGTETDISGTPQGRFLRFRADLSTPDLTKTPVLAEVSLYNAPAGKWYTITEQDEWKASPTLSNVDVDSLPGNVTLPAGTGSNICPSEEDNSLSVSMNTYANPIWDTITWWIGYHRWVGGDRQWRRLLTIKEPNIRDREYEPIDISGSFGAGRILKADCGDILVTTEVGTEVAYQRVSCNSAAGTFTIRLPVLVEKNGTVKYWVYYGSATVATPVYSKTSAIKFPHGDGAVRRRWGNPGGYNSGQIQYSTYWGRDKVNQVRQEDIADYFSARFDGWIYSAGTANLRVWTDDHQHVYVNNINYGLKAGTPGGIQDQTYTNALTAGFNRFTISMGDYSGGAGIYIYGVDANGNPSAGEIPNDALYVCWTQNTSGAGTPHETPEFNENVAGVKTWGPEQNKRDWVEDPQGRLIMDVRGSHDGTTWSAWTNVADYTPARGSGQTDPPTALSLPAQVKTYRFLQWRVTLDTAGNNSYSPILSQVYVKNVPEDKMYVTTDQPDFSNNSGYSNVDWMRRPGDLMLAEGTTSNTCITTETLPTSISEDTYRQNVWTNIRWFIGYSDWPGGLRQYRRLITITEPNQATRINEPIEVTVNVGDAAKVCDNGNDILLTTQVGSPVAYQLTQAPGAGSTFKILFPVTVAKNSNTKYYVYYGDSSCSYPAPYPPGVFTKSTSPRFPDGEGIVRRTWSNPNGYNNGTINFTSYNNDKTLVDTVNYSTSNQYFTAKFEGWIYHQNSANPGVRTNQDDHIRAWLNGALGRECYNCANSVSDWGNRPAGFSRITIETGNYTGPGSVYLYWPGTSTIIPKSELYMRWTSQTSNAGGGDDTTSLTYSVGAEEAWSPSMQPVGRTVIQTWGSHDGTTWTGPTTQVDASPLNNQPTWQALVAGSGSYRFLKFRATLYAPSPPTESPILAGVWFLHSDTFAYGADSQAGWTGSSPPYEGGPITATSNIDTSSRPGDILLAVTTPSNAVTPELGPISIGYAKDTYASPVWNQIIWNNCGFDYVRIRTATSVGGIGGQAWSGDLNPDTPPTCATTSANISGTYKFIQYNLKQTHRDRTTTISYVRLRDADGYIDDTNFPAGTFPTGTWAETPGVGSLRVVRWNATSDATGAGQSLDLSGHTYRRRYEFGTKNETREPVEFTVNANAAGYTTNNFTVCRYDAGSDTMQIVAHKLQRASGTAYTLLILLTGDYQVFYVYYGGTRTSPNYTKTHWDNSYGTGTGVYGSCFHNRNNFFSTSRDCGGLDNQLKANINYSQSNCFICGGGCDNQYFQDAWRGWVYTDTNTDLYVDTIDDNADCGTRDPAGNWSGWATNPAQAVTAQSWYWFEVRHRGYTGNDSVRFRGNVNAPMPQSHLYPARYWDYCNCHNPDTGMPSCAERAQQDINVGGEFYSQVFPANARYIDYYIYPGWWGYPFSSDIKLYFNKAYLEDTDRDSCDDKIEIWDQSTGTLLTTYYPPRNAAIDTGWLGDTYGNVDRNYIRVRYYYLRTSTNPSPGISIQDMRIRPVSANGGNSGANRPWRAIDNDINTYWAGGTPPKTIYFDIGALARIYRYEFRVYSNSWYRYRFSLSDDGSNWIQVSDNARTTWSTPPDANLWYYETFTATRARFGKLEILESSSGNSSIYEIRVYPTTYAASGYHEKQLQPQNMVSNQYLTIKGRRARLTFNSFNLRVSDVLRVYNAETGALLATFNAGAFPSGGGTTNWFSWDGYGGGAPSTKRVGLPLRLELTYQYSAQSPSGYSISGYEIEKLAWEEDRPDTHITSNPPYYAIDNNVNTYWDGLDNGSGRGIIVDLGRMKNLFKYEWVCENQAVYRYRVEVSVDRTNWIKVSDYYDANGQDPESAGWSTSCSGASPNCTYTDSFPQTDARYVRLTLFSGGNRVRELRIYPTTYQAQGYLIKQLPPQRITDEKIIQLPARNARIRFASLNLRGNVAGTRDELKIIDNDTGAVLATLTSANNGANVWVPSSSGWLISGTEKHTSSGLTLKLQLLYMYSGENPSGYSIDQYQYKKLAFDKNLNTGQEDIHTAGREPYYAIDNDDTNTYWETTGSNNVALVVHFGKMKKINKVSWKGVANTNYKYKIETSTDGNEWDLRSSENRYLNNQSSSDGWFSDSFPETEAMACRIVFIDTGVNARVYEFRCHETLYSTPGYLISANFPTPKRAWEFSVDGNLQNWSMWNQLTGASVSGGILRMQSTGADPYMGSEDNLGISGDEASYILIRMNVSAGTEGQVFFTTFEDTTWNETKSRRFPITTGVWKQYLIDMSDVPGWRGSVIKQIRIDPTNASTGANGIQIDYIRVLAPQKDTKTYYIGARDARLHFSKLYLRGYDRVKIYNERTNPPTLMLVYRNNIGLGAEHVDTNYPAGVVVDTANNMVDGSPTPGDDPNVTCTGNGFCTNWLSSYTNSGCPVENGYGIVLRVEYLYDYQAENSNWDGYKMDSYRTKVLIWDNDNQPDSFWQEGSPPVNYVGGNRPSYAIDNNTGTYWDGGAPIQKLIVDLGAPILINKINTLYNSSGIWWRYEILVSLDGADWKRVSSDTRLYQTIPMPSGGYVDTFLPQEVRYVMLRTTERQTAGNVQVAEFRIHQAVYATPGYGISYKIPSLKTGQQLQNPGFELNTGYDTPTYWTKVSGGPTSVEHVSDVRPNNSSSKQAIRLNTPAADNVYLRSDPIPVNPTDIANNQIFEYYLSGWIKTSGTTAAELGIEWYDAAGAQIKRDWVTWGTSANDTWQYFEGVYMSPSNAATARVFLARWNQSTGYAIYDDLRFSLADFQYDIRALRAAAGQIKPHFSRFQMVDNSSSISGNERMRDKLWLLEDSTGNIIDVDSGTDGEQVRTAADGGIINNPMTSQYNSNDTWLSYLGTADVRFILRYNYTGLADKGYLVDMYKYKPVSYSCDGGYDGRGSNPDKVIDGIVDNAQYWEPTDGAAGHNHWIEINLGKVTSLRKIAVVHQWNPSVTYKYKVELSPDGEVYVDIRSPGMNVDPATPDTWTTGVASGNYGSNGFAQTFTRFDAQYVRITYHEDHATTNKPKIVEVKIWETPYITPGSLTSEILPPKRRADTNPADGAIVRGSYRVPHDPPCDAGGTIVNGKCHYDTDWSFNNYGWAGGWVAASGNYQTVNSDGTLNAAGVDLNLGVWDGRLNLYYPGGNSFIYSVQNTTTGLFDAGVPYDSPTATVSYTVARHLQVNFQISGGATNSAWAYMTRTCSAWNAGGCTSWIWDWRYTAGRAVSTTNEFISQTWDMTDGSFTFNTSGTNETERGRRSHPWVIIVGTIPNNSSYSSIPIAPSLTPIAQPPTDITVPTPRPANEFERIKSDATPTLRVDISGATIPETGAYVKIIGYDAWGVAIEETLRFRENGTINTRRKFAVVTSVTTNGFSGGNILIRCLAFSGTIGRLAFRAHNGGARYVFIDSIRALPKVSYQKPYIMLEGTSIPSGCAPVPNPNNLNCTPNWAGAGFVNLHINKFRLSGDDLLQIWGKDTTGAYTVLLRSFDKNSFPSTDTNAGWTGNLGWGYDDLKIVLYHTPTGDSAAGNPAVTIDKFVRSRNFYASSVWDNDKPNWGAWRAADADDSTYWKSKATNYDPPWPPGNGNPIGWYIDFYPDLPTVNMVVVKIKGATDAGGNSVSVGDWMVKVSNDAVNWVPVTMIGGSETRIIFAPEKKRYLGVFFDRIKYPDRSIELYEVEIYEAGPYVNEGTYLSPPYTGSSHNIWTVPYGRDAYDVRFHFTNFGTQQTTQLWTTGASMPAATFSDILRIYAIRGAAVTPPVGDNQLLKALYGPISNWTTFLISQSDPNPPPPTPDPDIYKTNGEDDETGYRTVWLLAGNDGASPSQQDADIVKRGGAKFKLIWTAPLGYEDGIAGWTIDRYESWTAINPALIEIFVKGEYRGKESSLSTKVQPPNLLLK